MDELWRHTCFEAFIRRPDSAGYVELNFSPSGEWASYGFRAYREPDARAAAMSMPLMTSRRTSKGLELEAIVDIGNLWAPGKVLELGLSAVVEARDGSLSYWALAHPSAQPDFHHPDSFVLSLAMDGAA